jgi:hypothetical protein
MRNCFENWMQETEGKLLEVAKRYASAINRISEHYSHETGRIIDIYQIKDIQLLKRICTEYCRGGKFEDFGDKTHGLYRAAISAYVRFFEDTGCNNNSNFDEVKK